uniref:Uncharacterized protein n=1 Tax=Tanacetum cinerariifolium TaxID=118510 RepID=A0A6L2KVJ7_TANCI|nr:hypothetical protein [Tanacetum cinerariifolium]
MIFGTVTGSDNNCGYLFRNCSLRSQAFDLTVHDFNGFFYEMKLVVDMDFIQWSGDCETGSRSDNTIGSPHGFVIYGIEVLKSNEKVTEVIDVKNWRVEKSWWLRWIVSLFERKSFVSSTKYLIQRVGDEEVVVREGVVVTSSSLEMLTNNCLGGIMVSLIFLEGLEEETLVEFMVELFEENEDGKKNEKDGLFNLKAMDQSRKA